MPSIRFLSFPILLFLCTLSCKQKQEKNSSGGKPAAPAGVIGHIVAPGSIRENLEISGRLLAAETTEIHAETSGIIRSLHITEGSSVSGGTLLVKLKDDDLQAQLKKLRIQLQIAEKTEERNQELLRINGISQQDYDLSFLQVNNIRADIELLQTQIEKTEVRAPYNGKIGFRNISTGAYITPATVLTTIRQLQTLKLEFNVPEKYAGGVLPGTIITFNIQGTEHIFSAKVYATETSVQETSGGLLVRCIVLQQHSLLIPGAYASIRLNVNENNSALLIPSRAVIPQARGKKVLVYRNGTAFMTAVETGLRDSARVEITNGLREGDTILLTGLMSIKDGSSVKLTKVE
jgi:membrane fusion protein (multidrug efflux system)